MRRVLKFLGWSGAVVIGLVLAFMVYPELSESTKWGLSIWLVAMLVMYQVGKAEDRRNNFRFRVEDDLRQIKRRLGID